MIPLIVIRVRIRVRVRVRVRDLVLHALLVDSGQG